MEKHKLFSTWCYVCGSMIVPSAPSDDVRWMVLMLRVMLLLNVRVYDEIDEAFGRPYLCFWMSILLIYDQLII